jgi:hypothetical protein
VGSLLVDVEAMNQSAAVTVPSMPLGTVKPRLCRACCELHCNEAAPHQANQPIPTCTFHMYLKVFACL